MLQEGFGGSTAKKHGHGGNPRLKSGGYLFELLLLQTLHHAERRITHHTKKTYEHKRDVEFPVNGICVPSQPENQGVQEVPLGV